TSDIIISNPAIAVVILLEISACFIKTVEVNEVVNDICPIKKVGDHCVFRLIANAVCQVDRVVEHQAGATIRAITRVVTIFISMSVVTASDCEFSAGNSISVMPAEGGGGEVFRIADQASRTSVW